MARLSRRTRAIAAAILFALLLGAAWLFLYEPSYSGTLVRQPERTRREDRGNFRWL